MSGKAITGTIKIAPEVRSVLKRQPRTKESEATEPVSETNITPCTHYRFAPQKIYYV